ncbi:MAG: hypothetical protein WA771_10975 [Chthoniobacterales bacterium]
MLTSKQASTTTAIWSNSDLLTEKQLARGIEALSFEVEDERSKGSPHKLGGVQVVTTIRLAGKEHIILFQTEDNGFLYLACQHASSCEEAYYDLLKALGEEVGECDNAGEALGQLLIDIDIDETAQAVFDEYLEQHEINIVGEVPTVIREGACGFGDATYRAVEGNHVDIAIQSSYAGGDFRAVGTMSREEYDAWIAENWEALDSDPAPFAELCSSFAEQ